MCIEMVRRQTRGVAILSLVACLSFSSGAVAAEESDGWKFRITPYLWMLSLKGTTAALGQDVHVDASFGDILDVLNIALSANMELSKGRFFVVLDPLYSQLETDFKGPEPTPIRGKVDVDMVIADLNAGYMLNEHFDLYAGVRYYHQDVKVKPDLAPNVKLGDDWTDFLLGFRVRANLSDKWSFMGKADAAVAGDSDSAWYLQAGFLRHFGSNMHLILGWRYYNVDYKSGSGLDRFKWDVEHNGPVVGYSWVFGG